MKLQQIIEKHWYLHINFCLSLILFPLSIIFYIISRLRHFLYQIKIFKSYKLPVPLVIVGNISVGGVGKTPLTKYLALELNHLGINVGVILRGYKSNIKYPQVVLATDDSDIVGDEALIYAQNNIKVAIGKNRYLTGLKLLKEFPDIQLIISDDGLQHYSLLRDYEITVIDTNRMFGNRFLLPMGPLREKISRLNQVNAIVLNGNTNLNQKNIINKIQEQNPKMIIVEQKIILDKIYNPTTKEIANVNMLNKFNILALAAIGNPKRFFSFITHCGIRLKKELSFPDHYNFKENDIPSDYDVILVTEKDYVKLAKFNNAKIWVVLIQPELNNPDLILQIKNLKEQNHG